MSGKRKYITITAVLALLLAVAGGTLAWLSASGILINTFGIGTVEPKVEETLDGGTKSDVSVKNRGAAPAFIRAQVDIYWQDEDGNVLWEEPAEGTGYSIIWGDNVTSGSDAGSVSTWVKGSDGFYYWTGSVAPGAQTGQLIKSASAVNASSSKKLVIDISAQAIQSTPDDAVTEAWGCAVENGKLVPPTTTS